MGPGLSRVAGYVVAAVTAVLLGALVGLLGAFQHANTLSVGGVRLPLGLAASLAALVLAQLLARDALPYGTGPVVMLITWVITVSVFGSTRPEGDLVVAADAAGQTFLYGGFLLGVVVAVVLVRGELRRRAGVRAAPASAPHVASGARSTGR